MAVEKQTGASNRTRTIVTILLLIFALPIGLIVMWFWTAWEKTVKWVVTVVGILGFIPWFIIWIGIISLLAEGVLISTNPSGMVSRANNTARMSDVGAILNAVKQYSVDNNGQLPPGSPVVGDIAKDISSKNTGVEFCNTLVPTYLAKLPADPKTGSYTDCNTYETKYSISITSTLDGASKITVSAPEAELDQVISVTR